MDEQKIKQTWKQKLLFYITAFFVLLGTFSLFSFLFLVPFVIDPAFTTIFMEFDEEPAYCVTVKTDKRLGASNCSWTSCREGCTKDIYVCTQIFVNYKRMYEGNYSDDNVVPSEEPTLTENSMFELSEWSGFDPDVVDRSIIEKYENFNWYYKEARLLPNVKGCGYPPMLNCSIFLKTYEKVGTNFSCYYSRVDPSMVISHLDMWQVYMNLVYAMAIPIPSFILSVIYLAVAYFKIYNDDEEKAPLKQNAEAMNVEGTSPADVTTPVLGVGGAGGSGGITPASEAFREDLASFGHHFKVAMVDDISRDSLTDTGTNIVPLEGNLRKTMTTSISTSGGPITDI